MSWEFTLGMVAMVAYLLALAIAAGFVICDRFAHWTIRIVAGFAIFDALVFVAVFVAEPIVSRSVKGEGNEGLAWMSLGVFVVSGAIAIFFCGPILLLHYVWRWWQKRRAAAKMPKAD